MSIKKNEECIVTEVAHTRHKSETQNQIDAVQYIIILHSSLHFLTSKELIILFYLLSSHYCYWPNSCGICIRFLAGAGIFSFNHSIQTGSGAHPASSSVGTGGLPSGGGQTARA
jgi:hypothetical protein